MLGDKVKGDVVGNLEGDDVGGEVGAELGLCVFEQSTTQFSSPITLPVITSKYSHSRTLSRCEF